MTLHAFAQYIKYRLRARNRHGVHSPFVYALNDALQKDKTHNSLQDKLLTYFAGNKFIVLFPYPPGWIINGATPDTVLFLPGIHQTAQHTDKWNELIASPHVKLSIDFYKAGLLFFSEDFKEKQNFIIRY